MPSLALQYLFPQKTLLLHSIFNTKLTFLYFSLPAFMLFIHRFSAPSHSECVALQDPYCAWDKIAGKCRSHGAPRWLEENYFYQNVATGQHAACPSGKLAWSIRVTLDTDYDLLSCTGKINSKDANAGEQKGFRNDMDLLDSRRQSKDQEIIDNIDKNFEGDLPKRQLSLDTVFYAIFYALVRFVLCTFLACQFTPSRPPTLACSMHLFTRLPCPVLPVVFIANHIFILRGIPGDRLPAYCHFMPFSFPLHRQTSCALF